jgi:glutamyl-tRNA synthetase
MSSAVVRGRYAPSPSGTLHLGNLRTALLAWLCARAAGGQFVLRMEDLDLPRVQRHAAQSILDDLRWLGLAWDEGPDSGGLLGPYTQSARTDLYRHALATLRERELVYPCYCTRAELSRIASAPHAGESAPRYPGTCRTLTSRQRRAHEVAGRRPALRFRAPAMAIHFTDQLCGEQSEVVLETAGDFIVQRSDGIIAYQLAVVVDDALMGITQVVRGADLLSSTARQLALYDALGYARPHEYVHVPLAVDASGARLAKRDQSAGAGELRRQEIAPQVVVGALAASCGLWPAGEPAMPEDLLRDFSLARLTPDPTPVRLA